MTYYKEILLKNGVKAVLRSPTGADAPAILRHMQITSGETDNMLRYPDEITMAVENEAVFLDNSASSDDSLFICAEVGGMIVANGSIFPVSAVEKCRHRCVFGISILKSFWGLGIGSHILSAIINEARKAGYEQIELDVVSDNTRAVRLYEKFGFRQYGILRRAFKTRSGVYQDLYLMSLAV